MRFTFSIHAYITALVVATVLPFLLFSGLLVERAVGNEQTLIARSIRDAAEAGASDIDRRMSALVSLALTIGDARMLRIGDLAAFHARWSAVVARESLTAVVYDTKGRQLVNTGVPFDTVLPAEPAIVRSVIATGKMEISGLAREAGTEKPVLSISVPILGEHGLTHVLSLRITEAIAAVMTEQLLSPGQTAWLVDRDGTIIHRTRDPERFIGTRSPPDFLEQTGRHPRGTYLSSSFEDGPVHVAFSRVKLSGWVLAVSIPNDVLFAPAQRSLHRMLALGGGILLLAGLISWGIGRSIARSVAGLSSLAAAVGTGTHGFRPPATRIREVNAVATSMAAAAETLRHQSEERERYMDVLKSEIANRQRTEGQLVQSQKMHAMGQLTGGMAHDFNNLLSIIVGCLELLRDHWPDDPKSGELTEEAMKAALHGAELTRQLLAFARRQPLVPERCDINAVIGDFTRLLRRTLGEDITIDLHLAEALPPVRVDRVQLETSITNLANNARHAMPRGGRLTITTRETVLDEDYARTNAEVVPGSYVLIEVRDTGTGMKPEVLEHVFDPFFTTKEPGQGTGLGLSMVYGFLKQSGGHISAYSEPGEGTTFRLYLPPARDMAVPEAAAEPARPPLPERGQGERVLAVEDNAGLRQVLVRQLSSAGYQVVEADNAHAALDLIEGGERIDLLFTDIVMPGGMNGHELARRALLARPDVKILLTSGFSDMANGGAALPSHARLLRKPYREEELLRLVREALNE